MYTPEPIASAKDLPDLTRYVYQELLRISASFEAAVARNVEFLSVEPTKRSEGLTVGADGTAWNPGGGKGVYTYYSGAWNKLG